MFNDVSRFSDKVFFSFMFFFSSTFGFYENKMLNIVGRQLYVNFGISFYLEHNIPPV